MELLAAVTIIGVVGAAIVARVAPNVDSADIAACDAHKGEIEVQAQLWRRNVGSFPAANLADVGANAAYFPVGLPTCPVDGSNYSIDTTTGHVTGHTH